MKQKIENMIGVVMVSLFSGFLASLLLGAYVAKCNNSNIIIGFMIVGFISVCFFSGLCNMGFSIGFLFFRLKLILLLVGRNKMLRNSNIKNKTNQITGGKLKCQKETMRESTTEWD